MRILYYVLTPKGNAVTSVAATVEPDMKGRKHAHNTDAEDKIDAKEDRTYNAKRSRSENANTESKVPAAPVASINPPASVFSYNKTSQSSTLKPNGRHQKVRN